MTLSALTPASTDPWPWDTKVTFLWSFRMNTSGHRAYDTGGCGLDDVGICLGTNPNNKGKVWVFFWMVVLIAMAVYRRQRRISLGPMVKA